MSLELSRSLARMGIQDEAVLRALDKTEVLPRDVDGRVPPVMELTFNPKQVR